MKQILLRLHALQTLSLQKGSQMGWQLICSALCSKERGRMILLASLGQ